MISRALPLLLALVAAALIATGCGDKSTGSSLDTALSYVPKGAPLVVAVDTDRDSAQWQQVDKLLGKFPFGGQVKEGFKRGFNSRAGLDYDKDFRPLLGGDLVIAITAASARGTPTPYVIAWKVGDEDAAKRFAQRKATKVESIEGADTYRSASGRFAAVSDGVFVSARTREEVEAALKRPGGEHMSEQEFTDSLGDLEKDSLIRAAGNFQVLLSGPDAAAARKVKFLNALRTFGLTLRAERDGIEYSFRARTDGRLSAADLPLAQGAEAAPVIRRAGEVGFGLRNPAQIVNFGQQVARITDPAGYAKYTREKAKVSKQLGVDVDRDLIGQLTGNASVSVDVDGGFALRSDLRDPAAAQATLEKAAPRLVQIGKSKGKSLRLSKPARGEGFYVLTQPNGKKIVFGVVETSFVLATDAARAAQFVGQSPSTVPGAKGSLVVASDARSLANAIAKHQGAGVAVQILTSALGDLTGSVEAEPSGITGNLKLEIK